MAVGGGLGEPMNPRNSVPLGFGLVSCLSLTFVSAAGAADLQIPIGGRISIELVGSEAFFSNSLSITQVQVPTGTACPNGNECSAGQACINDGTSNQCYSTLSNP